MDELLSVKRQLKVLQKVAFNVEDEDGEFGEEVPVDPEHSISGSGQLEVLHKISTGIAILL